MDRKDKDEIMLALDDFRKETSNQNVLIIGAIETLQNQRMIDYQRLNKVEEGLEALKSNPPPPIPMEPMRERMPTLTTEERREQALTVTKSMSVQAESTRVIAQTVRVLPYVTAAGMALAAFIAGYMQYAAAHSTPQIIQTQPTVIQAPDR